MSGIVIYGDMEALAEEARREQAGEVLPKWKPPPVFYFTDVNEPEQAEYPPEMDAWLRSRREFRRSALGLLVEFVAGVLGALHLEDRLQRKGAKRIRWQDGMVRADVPAWLGGERQEYIDTGFSVTVDDIEEL